jgi:hypothetical protein
MPSAPSSETRAGPGWEGRIQAVSHGTGIRLVSWWLESVTQTAHPEAPGKEWPQAQSKGNFDALVRLLAAFCRNLCEYTQYFRPSM